MNLSQKCIHYDTEGFLLKSGRNMVTLPYLYSKHCIFATRPLLLLTIYFAQRKEMLLLMAMVMSSTTADENQSFLSVLAVTCPLSEEQLLV